MDVPGCAVIEDMEGASTPRDESPHGETAPAGAEGQGACEERCFITWGCGEFGQNGHHGSGDRNFSQGLHPSLASKRVSHVSCGSSHTVVVTESNEIFSWGNGNSGQLGCGDKENHADPVRIHLTSASAPGPAVAGVACGGRHTFIWDANGHMFSFGNNFFAQLGYDFRIKNYKENQVKPHLLRTLTYRCVQQVACGEKHTLFLFQGGTVATVGNGAYGQIGNDDRQETVVPRVLDDIPACRYIACGSNHNLAIDESGAVWHWGYGKACGSKHRDLLYPQQAGTVRKNAVKVAGGQLHSLALTGNGNVYAWGVGIDGQLGLGDNVKFVSVPTKLSDPNMRSCVAEISGGESYSTAVTGEGLLYMWGKNSHLIRDDKEANFRIFEPCPVETGGRTVARVESGAWHAAALTGGELVWQKENNDSDDDFVEEMDTSSCTSEELGYIGELGFLTCKTKTTLAEFYAPSPSPVNHRSAPGALQSRSGSIDQASRNPSRRISEVSVEPSPRPSLTGIVEDGDRLYRLDGKLTHRGSLPSIKDSELAPTPSQLSLPEVDGYHAKIKAGRTVRFHGDVADGSPSSASSPLEAVSSSVPPPSPFDDSDIEWHMTKLTAPTGHIMSASELHNKRMKLDDKKARTVQTSSSYADNFMLPREKTVLVNKNLDFVPDISSLSLATKDGRTLSYAKSSRQPAFVTEGKQDNAIDKGKGLRTPRERVNQAAIIAYRRGQKFLLDPDAAYLEAKRISNRDNAPKWDVESTTGTYIGGEALDPSPTLPRTVSLRSGESDVSRSSTSLLRQVSIPCKPQLQKQPTVLELAVDRPSRAALYSSASSWKHETDRAKINGLKKSRSDPRWMGIKMVSTGGNGARPAHQQPVTTPSPTRLGRQQPHPQLQGPLARKKELRDAKEITIRPRLVKQMPPASDKHSPTREEKSEVL